MFLYDHRFNHNSSAEIEVKVESFTHELGDFFGSFHKSISQCGYSIKDDLLDGHTYHNFSG